jgi:hypothetical protein
MLASSAKFELKKKHKPKIFALRVLYLQLLLSASWKKKHEKKISALRVFYLRLLQHVIRIRKAAEKKYVLRAWCSRFLINANWERKTTKSFCSSFARRTGHSAKCAQKEKKKCFCFRSSLFVLALSANCEPKQGSSKTNFFLLRASCQLILQNLSRARRALSRNLVLFVSRCRRSQTKTHKKKLVLRLITASLSIAKWKRSAKRRKKTQRFMPSSIKDRFVSVFVGRENHFLFFFWALDV